MDVADPAGGHPPRAARIPRAPDEGIGLRGEIQQSAYLGTSVSHIVGTRAPRSRSRSWSRAATSGTRIGDAVRIRWRAADAMVLARSGAGQPEEETQ